MAGWSRHLFTEDNPLIMCNIPAKVSFTEKARKELYRFAEYISDGKLVLLNWDGREVTMPTESVIAGFEDDSVKTEYDLACEIGLVEVGKGKFVRSAIFAREE